MGDGKESHAAGKGGDRGLAGGGIAQLRETIDNQRLLMFAQCGFDDRGVLDVAVDQFRHEAADHVEARVGGVLIVTSGGGR